MLARCELVRFAGPTVVAVFMWYNICFPTPSQAVVRTIFCCESTDRADVLFCCCVRCFVCRMIFLLLTVWCPFCYSAVTAVIVSWVE